MPRRPERYAPTTAVQSAPAIAGGRCALGGAEQIWTDGFNPRPPLLAGDAQPRLAVENGRCVSIRARHCWRAMHAQLVAVAQLPTFQSAPAIAGGRCRPRGWLEGAIRVSIRARHCWRAMLSMADSCSTCAKFQSAPAIAGGRCAACSFPVSQKIGFNPRPPLLAGDAGLAAKLKGAISVSIRARHCWRAMRARMR